jgi:hypothetical protein
MKRLITLPMVILLTFSVIAQSPQKMSYQAVIRDAGNNLVTSHAVGMRISILQGSATGTEIYKEIYNPNPQTNANGLVTVEIGGGIPLTGTFSTINWATGPFFLKTETDPTGGTNYTITGTSQLLSVPYALYSEAAQTADFNNLTNKPNLSGYLTSESDPVFALSPAHEVTNGNINNWNTAYGWGNHAGLYRSISWVPDWTDVTGKPGFAAVATSGNYNDLTNRPTLFDATWTSLTGKPTTIAGYGITDAMTTAHPANGISATNITNWNTAYGWGNHAGLYRPIGYVPTWSDITGKPTTLSGYGVTNPVNITILNVDCRILASVSSTWTNIYNIGSFTKLNSTSPIELTYNGRIAVTGSIGGLSVSFELRIDGVASTAGYARASIKKSEVGDNGIQVSITGIFNGLSMGTHTVSIWGYDKYGTSTDIMVDPGCFSTDVVIIKEFR